MLAFSWEVSYRSAGKKQHTQQFMAGKTFDVLSGYELQK